MQRTIAINGTIIWGINIQMYGFRFLQGRRNLTYAFLRTSMRRAFEALFLAIGYRCVNELHPFKAINCINICGRVSVFQRSVYESGFRSLLALFRNRGYIRLWQDEVVRLSVVAVAFLVPFFRQTTSVYWHFVSTRCAAWGKEIWLLESLSLCASVVRIS